MVFKTFAAKKVANIYNKNVNDYISWKLKRT